MPWNKLVWMINNLVLYLLSYGIVNVVHLYNLLVGPTFKMEDFKTLCNEKSIWFSVSFWRKEIMLVIYSEIFFILLAKPMTIQFLSAIASWCAMLTLACYWCICYNSLVVKIKDLTFIINIRSVRAQSIKNMFGMANIFRVNTSKNRTHINETNRLWSLMCFKTNYIITTKNTFLILHFNSTCFNYWDKFHWIER